MLLCSVVALGEQTNAENGLCHLCENRQDNNTSERVMRRMGLQMKGRDQKMFMT